MPEPVFITDESIADANRRHDLAHGDPFDWNLSRTRSGWNSARLIGRGPLTDRKIEKYAEAGWYSAEFKKQRKLYNDKKRGVNRREGNFDIVEGRLIYRP